MTANHVSRVFIATVALLALASLLGCGGGNACKKNINEIGDPSGDPGGGGVGYASNAEECFAYMNAEREKVGSAPLEWDEKLSACAAGHSHDMCERGFRAHENPDGMGPSDRATSGYAGRFTFEPCTHITFVSENIAWSYTTGAAAVAAWMGSTMGHRENMLNAQWTHVGIGTCRDEMQGHGPCTRSGHGCWTANFYESQ